MTSKLKIFATNINIVLFVFTAACSKDKNIDIEIKRDGDFYIASTESVSGVPQDERYKKHLESLLVNKQWVMDYYFPEDSISDLFIIFPISSSRELWHSKGSERVSVELHIDPLIYPCEGIDSRRGFAKTFPRYIESSDGIFHYDAIMYLPALFPNSLPGSILLSPMTDDMCMRIDRNISNRDPYINGSTHYSSNELRFTADEINAILETIPQTEN